MSKMNSRRMDYISSQRTTNIASSVDDAKAFQASLDKINNRHKTKALIKMQKLLPRDERLYTSNDMYRNIQLENTRDEREEEQTRKNKERLERARLRTQAK